MNVTKFYGGALYLEKEAGHRQAIQVLVRRLSLLKASKLLTGIGNWDGAV